MWLHALAHIFVDPMLHMLLVVDPTSGPIHSHNLDAS